jgi:hypothetical protein
MTGPSQAGEFAVEKLASELGVGSDESRRLVAGGRARVGKVGHLGAFLWSCHRLPIPIRRCALPALPETAAFFVPLLTHATPPGDFLWLHHTHLSFTNEFTLLRRHPAGHTLARFPTGAHPFFPRPSPVLAVCLDSKFPGSRVAAVIKREPLPREGLSTAITTSLTPTTTTTSCKSHWHPLI